MVAAEQFDRAMICAWNGSSGSCPACYFHLVSSQPPQKGTVPVLLELRRTQDGL